eukprot:1662579-Pyramimonas_sp.AAC.2
MTKPPTSASLTSVKSMVARVRRLEARVELSEVDDELTEATREKVWKALSSNGCSTMRTKSEPRLDTIPYTPWSSRLPTIIMTAFSPSASSIFQKDWMVKLQDKVKSSQSGQLVPILSARVTLESTLGA